jgi:RNA polymerase-binding transcription factor DksA
MAAKKAQLTHDSAMLELLTANPSADPTFVERAMTALHMYSAVEAIEEFTTALVRLEDGRYGSCQSCGRPIPIERLEAIPQTRVCAACPSAADASRRQRIRRARRERGGDGSRTVDRRGAALATVDPGVLAESRSRHPSAIRYEHPINDRAR